MTDHALHALAETVQHNCHISDARHGADYSLCVYLMKMREYFRWEKHLPYGASLARDQVGNWLAEREQLWETLEEAELRPLVIDGQTFEPFDVAGVNARLMRHGLVYSAGTGSRAKPHFFLGALECEQRTGDYAVYVSAEEHARDLTAPPAMTLGRSIFLRRESLRRMLWEKLEGWRWSRPDNALGRAFSCYAFETDLEDALEEMTDREIGAALLHERGEFEAGQRLGDEDWGRMLMDLMLTPAEIMARAVRDHLADCLVTLPTLADAGEPAPLHFYVGNLTAMRREVFPALMTAYQGWVDQGGSAAAAGSLRALAKQGATHWETLAREMLALHRERGVEAAAPIGDLVRTRAL